MTVANAPRMKTTLVAAVAVVAAGCSVIVGSGKTVTEPRNVGEFRGLAVQSGLRAKLVVGPRAVAIATDDNLLRYIESKLENGIVVVRMQKDVQVAPKFFEAIISAPSLASIDVSGTAFVEGRVHTPETFSVISSGQSVAILDGIQTTTFRIDASDGSSVTASGETRDEVLKASGASRIDFSALPAQLLEVDLSGASFATARVKAVRGSLSGASQLQILGSPSERTVSLSDDSSLGVTP